MAVTILQCLPQNAFHPAQNVNSEFIGRTECWNWNSNTLATWFEELTHWKRPWCWERLRVGEEGDDRGWDGWMAPPTQWTWVWVDSGSWWWTGRSGLLRFMGSDKESDKTERLNWTELKVFLYLLSHQWNPMDRRAKSRGSQRVVHDWTEMNLGVKGPEAHTGFFPLLLEWQ